MKQLDRELNNDSILQEKLKRANTLKDLKVDIFLTGSMKKLCLDHKGKDRPDFTLINKLNIC